MTLILLTLALAGLVVGALLVRPGATRSAKQPWPFVHDEEQVLLNLLYTNPEQFLIDTGDDLKVDDFHKTAHRNTYKKLRSLWRDTYTHKNDLVGFQADALERYPDLKLLDLDAKPPRHRPSDPSEFSLMVAKHGQPVVNAALDREMWTSWGAYDDAGRLPTPVTKLRLIVSAVLTAAAYMAAYLTAAGSGYEASTTIWWATAGMLLVATTGLVLSLVDLDTCYRDPMWFKILLAGTAIWVAVGLGVSSIRTETMTILWQSALVALGITVLFGGIGWLLGKAKGTATIGTGDLDVMPFAMTIIGAAAGASVSGPVSLFAGMVTYLVVKTVMMMRGKTDPKTPDPFLPYIMFGWVALPILMAGTL